MSSYFPTFPGTFFGDSYGPQPEESNFPAFDFRQNALANNLGGNLGGDYLHSDYQQLMDLFSPGPATKTFMDYVQNLPNREEYRPNLGQKIAAGVAGLSYGLLGNPMQGNKAGQDILNQPYERAIEDYKLKVGGLGQAANIEAGQQKQVGSLLPDLMKMREAGYEFGRTAGQKDITIGQEGQKIALSEKELEQKRVQAELDRALAEKRISVDQYQAATQRMNANTAASLSPSEIALREAQAKYYTGAGRQTSTANPANNASLQSEKARAEILADPVLVKYAEEIFKNQPDDLLQDPVALDRLTVLYRRLGLVQPYGRKP